MALHKRLKKTFLALFVLVIPSVCYMLLRTGTNYYQNLPVYGPDGKTELADSIPDSAWYRVDGFSELENKIYVAGFMRARAGSEAETLAVNMMRLAKTYQDLGRLGFVAFIAIDSAAAPAGPTPFEELIDKYGGDSVRWSRVRIPEEEAARVVREEYLLTPSPGAGTGLPLSDTLVLIDSRRRIRGYYDGSSYFDTDTLEDEIAVLWKEEMNRDDQQ